jgi:hypothetical protein
MQRVVCILIFVFFIYFLSVKGIFAAISVGTPSIQEGDTNSLTFTSLGVGGSQPLLVVFVHGDNAAVTINSVQCETTNLTQIVNAIGGGNKTLTSAYYLDPASNPGDGSCDNLVVIRSGSDPTTATAVVLSGVDQTTPVDTGTAQSWISGKVNGAQTLTVTGTNSGDLAMDAATSYATMNYTSTGQTEEWNRELGGTGISGHYAAGSSLGIGGTSVSMTVNNEANDFITHIAFNINQHVALSISLETNGSVSFGYQALDTTQDSSGDVEIISVDSGPADLDVKSTNFSDGTYTWTLSTSNDYDQVHWEFSKDGSAWSSFAAADTPYAFDTYVGVGETRPLYFQLTTPTGTSSYDPFSTTVTVIASAP